MKLIDRYIRTESPARSGLSFTDYLTQTIQYSFGGNSYTLPANTTYGKGATESIPTNFDGYVRGAYAANGVVFACILARALPFAEARFQWRQIVNGRPGDLFGTQGLSVLERPWPNGTTGELLVRMIQDVDLAGNFYAVREDTQYGQRLTRLNPQHVHIVLSGTEWDARVVGYIHKDPKQGEGSEQTFAVDEVVHWSPIPDPLAHYRGMSWLTPVLREIQSHKAASSHREKFFGQAATPNAVLTMPKEIGRDEFERWAEKFRADHEGIENAYKTLLIGAGADYTVVGSSFEQMQFAQTQGRDETLIAAAAGVPPVIVGLSEGLQAATYSNYGQARRRFADGTLRPLWRSACAALQTVLDVPAGAELWYDDRDIAYLRVDAKEEAEIKQASASTLRQLVEGGWEPDAAVDAVLSGDFARLTGEHTGLMSVQLTPPSTGQPEQNSEQKSQLLRDDE